MVGGTGGKSVLRTDRVRIGPAVLHSSHNSQHYLLRVTLKTELFWFT